MAGARARANWAPVSALMAVVANTARDPKRSRPFTADDFDPFRATQPIPRMSPAKAFESLRAGG